MRRPPSFSLHAATVWLWELRSWAPKGTIMLGARRLTLVDNDLLGASRRIFAVCHRKAAVWVGITVDVYC